MIHAVVFGRIPSNAIAGCRISTMTASLTRFDRQSSPHPHGLSCGARVTLEIVRGRARERCREVTETVFLIGSAADCDMVLGDPDFPSAYAYLYVTDGGVTLRSLGGGPELLVRGSAVSTVAAVSIQDGDLIELGPLALRIRIELSPPGDLRTRSSRERELGKSTTSDAAIDTATIDSVRALLADIRQALASDSNPLRLYCGPEPSMEFSGRVRKRATA